MSERLMIALAVLVPLLMFFFGWPKVTEWLAGPALQPAPDLVIAAPTATPPLAVSAAAPTGPVTSAPVLAPTAPVTAAPVPAPTVPPTSIPAPVPTSVPVRQIEQRASTPGETVASFYALVGSREFDAAAQLWSPRMRSRFPPGENIVQRFSQTDSVRVRRVDVLSQDDSRAVVAVDVLENHRAAGARAYVGNWHLVRGPDGWLLDEPDLRTP